MTDILFAEDDPQIREWVTYSLERDHHQVRAVADGAAALVAYAEKRPDLLILDIMMPKFSGYDVLLKIRETDRQLPVLLLTAKSTENDKVVGLGIGADDYMTKPFGVRELQARVSALLRRAAVNASSTRAVETFRFATFKVNAVKRTLQPIKPSTSSTPPHLHSSTPPHLHSSTSPHLHSSTSPHLHSSTSPHLHSSTSPLLHSSTSPLLPEISLSEHEVGILKFLAAHPNEVVSRDALLNGVWGTAYDGTNRTLDNRILALRKKLGPASDSIETVYGTGYRYRI